MSDRFDPYYKWLGIPPEEQPPNHYRLLGVRLFESDADVIESSADGRMAHLRNHQAGQHAALSQQLLNEVAAARVCLLNAASRGPYDLQLKQKLAPSDPLPTAQPVPTAGPSPGSQPVAAAVAPVAPPRQPSAPVAPPPNSHRSPANVAVSLTPTASASVASRARAKRKAGPWANPTLLGVGASLLVAIGAAVVFLVFNGGGDDERGSRTNRAIVKRADLPSKARSVAPANASGVDKSQTSLTPLKPPAESSGVVEQTHAPANTIDLLDVAMMPPGHEAKWTKEGETWIADSAGATLLFPVEVPQEYILRILAEPQSGESMLFLGLTGRGRKFRCFLNAKAPGRFRYCGLGQLDGKDPHRNAATNRTNPFTIGQRNQIDIVIKRVGVKVVSNDRTIIDFAGPYQRLGFYSKWTKHKEQLYLDVFGGMRFQKIQLIPLSPSPSG